MKKILISTIALCALSACTSSEKAKEPQLVDMPNPASKYCIDIGGSLETVNTKDGAYGICTLPDGTKIEEWELFRRDHPEK